MAAIIITTTHKRISPIIWAIRLMKCGTVLSVTETPVYFKAVRLLAGALMAGRAFGSSIVSIMDLAQDGARQIAPIWIGRKKKFYC